MKQNQIMQNSTNKADCISDYSNENRKQRCIAAHVRKMHAYEVPDAMNMVKLDVMENPFGLPESLKKAWSEKLLEAEINRYPDPRAETLRSHFIAEITKQHDSGKKACDVLFGNGSDELIQLLVQALPQDAVIMSPVPSFSMYEVYAGIMQKSFKKMSLNDDFSINREKALAEIEDEQPALIFISYPNNPTGNLFDKNIILEIIEKAPGLVVIDEAYGAFSSDHFDEIFLQYDHVLLLKTLSKIGFAGIRFGMLFGAPHWIEDLNKIRPPFNVNSLTQKAVEFYLQNQRAFAASTEKLKENRQKVMHELKQIHSIKAFPSEANFITIKLLNHSAAEVYASLKQQGVLIKNLHQDKSLLSECLRITIGTDEENQAFLVALKQALKQQ